MLLNGTCWYSQLGYIFDQREVHIVFCEQTEWQAGKVWAWFKKIKLSSNKDGSYYLVNILKWKSFAEKIQRILELFNDLFSEKIQ